MNSHSKFFKIIIFLIIIQSTISINLGVAQENDNNSKVLADVLQSQIFLQKYKTSFKSPDNEPIIAFAKVENNNKFLAFDQALIALNFLNLADEAETSGLLSLSNNYISEALATIKFMTSYLVNSLTREKIGIIEYWDNQLQDQGLTRVSKLARDQALVLLAIDKVLTFIENGYSVENSTLTFFKESFQNIWTFLMAMYDESAGGWFTKTTAISQTEVSIDKTKRTSDNMIIISSLAEIKHPYLLAPDFSQSKLNFLLASAMDLFSSKFLIENKGISSYGSSDGSNVVNDIFFTKENTLYGLANSAMFSLTNNDTFLNNAKYIWNYIKTTFWEIGFGGVFIGVNSAGDPTIAGKSLEDQIFYSLLSLKLSSQDQSNNDYLSYFLKMNKLIKYNFVKNNNIASSTDLRFNPSTEYYVRSSAYYINYLIEEPHVSSISLPNTITIGEKLPVKIFIRNSESISMNISISGNVYLIPKSITTTTNTEEIELSFQNTVQSGSQNINFNITISKTSIQQFSSYVTLNPNVRIPNGLIYLVGAGLLAGIVVLVRRPPEIIREFIKDLNPDRIENTVNENEEQS